MDETRLLEQIAEQEETELTQRLLASKHHAEHADELEQDGPSLELRP